MKDSQPLLGGEQDWSKLENLKRHPIYAGLTEKQQKFISVFVETQGDKVAAAEASYTCKSKRAAEQQALVLLRKGGVRQLLAMYYGYSTDSMVMNRDEYLQQLSKRLRDPRLSAKDWIELSDRLVELQGWTPRSYKPRTADDMPGIPSKRLPTVDEMVKKYEEKNGRLKSSAKREEAQRQKESAQAESPIEGSQAEGRSRESSSQGTWSD